MPTIRTRPPLTRHTMSRKMCGAGLSVQKTGCISFDSGLPWMAQRTHPLPMPSWKVRLRCVAFIVRCHLIFETSNFAGYDWEGLPEGSLVVDVGGGVGAQSLTIAQHHPQIRFVIQDRESVLGDATDVCVMTRISPSKIWRVLTVCTAHSTGRGTCQVHSNPAA
jgi:hypothetical protein